MAEQRNEIGQSLAPTSKAANISATIRNNLAFPTASEWQSLREQATIVVKSGMLPQAIRTAEQAIAVALKGRELGIPMMQAFAQIHIINGKPTISAELMLALIFRNIPRAKMDLIESDDNICRILAQRPGGKPFEFSFSIEQAKQADLLSKTPWRQYPQAMLRARTIALAARAVFPDAIMGCSYTPEELGADVEMTEDGIMKVVESEVSKSSSESAPRAVEPEVLPKAQTHAAAARPQPVQRQTATSPVQGGSILPAPVCCGGVKMEVSKYIDKAYGHEPYWCRSCKAKAPRLAAAPAVQQAQAEFEAAEMAADQQTNFDPEFDRQTV